MARVTVKARSPFTRTIDAEILKEFCTEVFESLGVMTNDAQIISDVLVASDIRGVDSHGVARLSRYVNDLRQGVAFPRAQARVVHETPVTAVIDGCAALGPPVAHYAMNLAISKAADNFLGFVAVRNSNHYGIAGYYPMMALKHNMIGISTTNAKPAVLPTFGLQAMFGTNPISIAVPTSSERPFVLDMATSTVAHGKIEVYERLEKPIPRGWVADTKGQLTRDPVKANKVIVGKRGGGLLPLGGIGEEMGGHKGYGLGFAVEVFSALLSGAACSDLSYQRDDKGHPLPPNIGHFFAAIRIDGFRPLPEFRRDMDALIHRIKNSRRTHGSSRIYIHGEKEYETTERRRREGIPLNHKVVASIRNIAKELSLEDPFSK